MCKLSKKHNFITAEPLQEVGPYSQQKMGASQKIEQFEKSREFQVKNDILKSNNTNPIIISIPASQKGSNLYEPELDLHW